MIAASVTWGAPLTYDDQHMRVHAVSRVGCTVGAMRRGIWIVLEGGDGSGKSTQVQRLASRLDAVCAAEPGGTALGEGIREVLLDVNLDEVVDPVAEALLYAADRAQHVARVVAPALTAGRHVVSSRSVWSSIAYQTVRGVDESWLMAVNDAAMRGCWPDLVVWLDTAAASSFRRSVGRGPLDRLELLGETFQQQVSARFDDLAKRFAWLRVDASGSVDEVASAVWAAVDGHLSGWDGSPASSPPALLREGWR